MATPDMNLQVKIEGDIKDIQGKITDLLKTINGVKKETKKTDLFSNFEDQANDLASNITGSFGKIGQAISSSLNTPIGATSLILAGLTLELKTLLDLGTQGEKLNKIKGAFDNLSSSVGLASDALATRFKAASDGLLTDTQVYETLNRSFINLGDKVSQLPRVMELARKATDIFGGDVTQNFEAMTRAVESGNTRILRSVGIYIDADKALEKYAKSLGVQKERLSEAGRQQAILNELLTVGEKKFKDIGVASSGVEDATKRFNVALGNIGDQLKKFVDNNYSGVFASIFEAITTGLKKINGDFTLTDRFKEAEVAMDKAKTKLFEMREEFKALSEDGAFQGVSGAVRKSTLGSRINQQTVEVAKLTKQYNLLFDEVEKVEKATKGGGIADPNKGSIAQTILGEDPEETKIKMEAFFQRARDLSEEWVKQNDKLKGQVEELKNAFASGLSNALIDFADGTASASQAFDKFARNFLRRIAEMILQQAILNSIAGFFPRAGGANPPGKTVPTGFGQTMTAATGGLITGPGTGTSDSINAKLSNGEYVIKAAAVKKYGANFFHNLNSMKSGVSTKARNRFADGGLVESSQMAPQVVIQNSGSDKQVTGTSFDPATAVTTVFISDMQKNGPISKALQSNYSLKRGGFK